MPYVGDHIWNFNKLCWWAMVWWGAEKHRSQKQSAFLSSQCFRLEEWKAERKHNPKQLSLIIPRAKCHNLIAANTINKTPDHFGEGIFLFSGRMWWQDWFNLSHKPVSHVSLAEEGVEERAGKLLAWLRQRHTDRQKERKKLDISTAPFAHGQNLDQNGSFLK